MIETFRLVTAKLLQAMRSTDNTAPFVSRGWAVIGAFRSFHCSIVLASGRSPSGPLFYRFPVVVFFDRGHPCFRNFNSTIFVDVIRVKSYADSFLDPTCVPVRSTINKLHLVPNRIVACLVGVFSANSVGIQLRVSSYKKSIDNWINLWSRLYYLTNGRVEYQSRSRNLLQTHRISSTRLQFTLLNDG